MSNAYFKRILSDFYLTIHANFSIFPFRMFIIKIIYIFYFITYQVLKVEYLHSNTVWVLYVFLFHQIFDTRKPAKYKHSIYYLTYVLFV